MRTRTPRSLLLAFVVSIACCPVLGIYCLLIGRMGSIEFRILATAADVSAASILGFAGAIPCERRCWNPLGPLGVLSTAIALVLVLLAIWVKPSFKNSFYEAVGVSCVIGVALPHIGLLSLARLQLQYGWVRRMTIVAIILLAASIIYLIVASPIWPAVNFWERLIGVFSILYGCGTITVPIMHRVSSIRVREEVKTVEFLLTMTCPRCEKPQQLPAGRSKCMQCGL